MKGKLRFTGLWIPAELWLRTDLAIEEKVLVAQIHALSDNSMGRCYALNKYFSEFLQRSPRQVVRYIENLEAKGLVRREAAQGKRYLSSILSSLLSSMTGPMTPVTPPHDTGDTPPMTPVTPIESKSESKPKEEPEKVVTDLFWQRFEQETGAKPMWKAQYREWRKRLWASAGKDDALVAAIVGSYFTEAWFFTKGKAFSFDGFFQHWSEILSHVMAKGHRSSAADVPLTQERIDAAIQNSKELGIW